MFNYSKSAINVCARASVISPLLSARKRMTERRLQAHNTSRLIAVEAALKRIRAGEYGYCLDTGAEIGLQRLIANPAAERTVEQQDRLERRSRQFGRMVVAA
jgi:RNA polymerase-binding transcription factor DksA